MKCTQPLSSSAIPHSISTYEAFPRLGIAFPLIASTLYAVKLLPASPVYFLVAAYVLCNLTRLTHGPIRGQDLGLFLSASMFIIYVSFMALVGFVHGDKAVLLPTYVNILLGLMMIVILLPESGTIDYELLCKSSRIGLYGIISVNTIDTFARITRPGVANYEHLQIINENPDLWFYKYKFGGFMFADSNQNGIVLVAALCLAFAILHFSGRGKIAVLLCVALLAATFSRAAWAAGAAAVFLRLLISHPIAFRIAIACILGISLSAFSSTMLLADSSFSSKINIVHEIIEAITRRPELVMFGIGLGQSEAFLGIYSHILPLTAFIESGVVGLVLYSVLLLFFFFRGGPFVKLYVISVFLVSGMSSFIYMGAPCVFIPLMVILLLEKANGGGFYASRTSD